MRITPPNDLVAAATLVAAASATLAPTAPAQAPTPVSGKPVPELAGFDSIMTDFMEVQGIRAGVLGIMKDGVIVYQRGFGWKDKFLQTPLRHDALMRIASCTKPTTAAAVQRLVSTGQLDLSDKAFDLGQPGGGILDLAPFPSLGDARLEDVTIAHLIDHRGGWDRDVLGVGDLTYMETAIGNDYFLQTGQGAWPPGREKTMRWILGQPLQVDPGTEYHYSNVGFLALGLIVEEVTGQSHFDFVRGQVYDPMPWMPLSEVVWGRTFAQDQDPREPHYDAPQLGTNVFAPFSLVHVPRPYGTWDHEARVGQGALVASTTALLHLANTHYVSGSAAGTLPYGGLVSSPTNREHSGRLHGTRAVVVQRADGVNYAVIFNRREPNGQGHFITAITNLIEAEIASVTTWPTGGIDGQWMDLDEAGGSGSYEAPWGSLDTALSLTPHEGTLNLKPSSSGWTGVIDQKVRIRAHGGSVVIGG